MSLVEAGRYNAKVAAHAITKTKSGLPQALVKFEFEDNNGEKRVLTWFGSFKDGALPHTIKALVNCGLKGNNPGGDLEIGKEVSIVVEIDKDQSGVDRNTVRWVNSLNAIKDPIDSREALAALEQFSGAVMAVKKELGADKESSGFDPDEEIPF